MWLALPDKEQILGLHHSLRLRGTVWHASRGPAIRVWFSWWYLKCAYYLEWAPLLGLLQGVLKYKMMGVLSFVLDGISIV